MIIDGIKIVTGSKVARTLTVSTIANGRYITISQPDMNGGIRLVMVPRCVLGDLVIALNRLDPLIREALEDW